jgi:hypothetical protein
MELTQAQVNQARRIRANARGTDRYEIAATQLRDHWTGAKILVMFWNTREVTIEPDGRYGNWAYGPIKNAFGDIIGEVTRPVDYLTDNNI